MADPGVVDPGDAEHDDALGFDEALEQARLLVSGLAIDDGSDGGQHLVGGLDEFRLIGITLVQLLDNSLGIAHRISL